MIVKIFLGEVEVDKGKDPLSIRIETFKPSNEEEKKAVLKGLEEVKQIVESQF